MKKKKKSRGFLNHTSLRKGTDHQATPKSRARDRRKRERAILSAVEWWKNLSIHLYSVERKRRYMGMLNDYYSFVSADAPMITPRKVRWIRVKNDIEEMRMKIAA